MRFLGKAIVVGFAALGAYRAWELLSPKIGIAKTRTSDARDRLEPALRDAADTVRTASREAIVSVADASVDVAEAVGQAVVDLGDVEVATDAATGSPSTTAPATR